MEMRPLATKIFGSLIAALLPLLFAALGASAPVVHRPNNVITNLSAAKWGPAPRMLSPSAQIAVPGGEPNQGSGEWERGMGVESGSNPDPESPSLR